MEASGARASTRSTRTACGQRCGSLLDAGCESLVIHFLHAYANPAHEQRAAEIAAELWPNGYITVGHALLSEAREFERGVTAAVNAIGAADPRALRRAAAAANWQARGYRRDFLIMNGNGGMISARIVTREAAKTVMSGPASGVIAAAYTGRRAGFTSLVTYDMGGTSTDVALILDAEPSVSNEIEIEYAMPIHVPMVAVHTIGAGGGSIARVDASGLIAGRAGKRGRPTRADLLRARRRTSRRSPTPTWCSAGSTPTGCWRSTIRLPSSVCGRSSQRRSAPRRGSTASRRPARCWRLGNMKMAGAIRMVSVARGHDPRDFTLFAFGGAGPLHASALARELGLPRVLVPARPGITNALGCVVADLRHDFVNTVNQPLARLDEASMRAGARPAAGRGRGADRARRRCSPRSIRAIHSADMQFVGQTHILNVPLPVGRGGSRARCRRCSRRPISRASASTLPEIRANLVNLNTSVIGVRPDVDLSQLIDPAGRAATLDEARRDDAAGLVRRRVDRHAGL